MQNMYTVPTHGKHGPIVIPQQHCSVSRMEIIAHALAATTGKHGSVLCMELITRACPLCSSTLTYVSPQYGYHNSMDQYHAWKSSHMP